MQLLLPLLFSISCCCAITLAGAAGVLAFEEQYGPVNLLKVMPTPFGGQPAPASPLSAWQPPSRPPGTSSLSARLGRRSLGERLVSSRLYLPGRMVLGKPAEFTIKGRPGSLVALAMADKDSGAKPIYGQKLRLGPDRKVVGVGVIPETGVLSIVIETPIQGDLIGAHWFFEAAIWSQPDFSDTEIATTVSSEGQEGIANGVIVAADPGHKRGLRFVPSAVPLEQTLIRSGSGLGTGRL